MTEEENTPEIITHEMVTFLRQMGMRDKADALVKAHQASLKKLKKQMLVEQRRLDNKKFRLKKGIPIKPATLPKTAEEKRMIANERAKNYYCKHREEMKAHAREYYKKRKGAKK